MTQITFKHIYGKSWTIGDCGIEATAEDANGILDTCFKKIHCFPSQIKNHFKEFVERFPQKIIIIDAATLKCDFVEAK